MLFRYGEIVRNRLFFGGGRGGGGGWGGGGGGVGGWGVIRKFQNHHRVDGSSGGSFSQVSVDIFHLSLTV